MGSSMRREIPLYPFFKGNLGPLDLCCVPLVPVVWVTLGPVFTLLILATTPCQWVSTSIVIGCGGPLGDGICTVNREVWYSMGRGTIALAQRGWGV